MRLGHELTVIANRAVRRRVLQYHPEQLLAREVDRVSGADVEVDPKRLGTRLQDGDRLWVTVLEDEEPLFPLARFPMRDGSTHGHSFGCGGRLIQQRGIGQGQPGQVRDHSLEIQERLQPPLCNFRLVGCVLGIPARVLQDIALNHRWGDAIVIAHADEGTKDLVPPRQGPQLGEHFLFAEGTAKRQTPPQANLRWHGSINQRIERLQAERRQHLLNIGVRRAQMAMDKGIGRSKELPWIHGRFLAPRV